MRAKINKTYKEPIFLFTSSSMRQAAWAGWYSALGNKKQAERFIHSAHSEWLKELGAGRRYAFLDRYNNDIWKHVPDEKLKILIDNLFKSLKEEIKRSKINSPRDS